MGYKSTLKEESYNLYNKLSELCSEAIIKGESFDRLNRVMERAAKRDARRHKKELTFGVVHTNKVSELGVEK